MSRPDLSHCPLFEVTRSSDPRCMPLGALVEGTLGDDGTLEMYCCCPRLFGDDLGGQTVDVPAYWFDARPANQLGRALLALSRQPR